MILVTGASGNVGGEVAAAVAAHGAPVCGLVRDPRTAQLPPGVEAVPGDLTDPASLRPALGGVEAVFLLGGWPEMPSLMTQIARAGVEHVVLLSSRSVDGGKPDNPIVKLWLGSEAAVRDGGVPWTILHPSGFQSNVLRWRDQWRAGDVVRAPWGNVPIAAIDPADIAAVAAVALTESTERGVVHELSGPQALTPGDQVEIIGRALGRPLRFEAVPDEQARAEMAVDTPPEMVDAFFRFYSDGEFDDGRVLNTVQSLTGRPARAFADWAQAHLPALP